jgi:methionyl-tRNA formyltransferase
MTLRVAYMGTPQIACPSLEALIEMVDFNVVGVFTQPDRPSGRGKKVEFSAVKYLAHSRGLDIFQPITLKDPAFEETIKTLDLDLIVVMAYGQILPQRILDLPKHGALNIHASILPRHRGAAPIQWAIIKGDNETGVSLMKMDAGMDTGDVISTMSIPIRETESAVELTDKISMLGAEIISRDLSNYISGKLEPQKQNESFATHASKIEKTDGLIDWSMAAVHIHRRMRAYNPWPGIFTYLPKENNRTLKIVSADVLNLCGTPGEVIHADKSGITIACGKNSLLATQVQRQGGKQLSAQDFLNGNPINIGDIFR